MLILLSTIVAAGAVFTCTPVKLWDGDGPIWCAEGPKVRLAGIAAREIDGQCLAHHPCPRASGIAARDHLAQLLGGVRGRAATGHLIITGPALRCVSTGGAKRDRTGAWCVSPKTGDLSCALVKTGYAVRWPSQGGARVCARR